MQLPHPQEVQSLRTSSKKFEKIVTARHTAEQLWPYFSQVNEYNRAGGSSPVEYEVVPILNSASLIVGTSKKFGIKMRYKELPYEWHQPRYVHAEMFFESGPFRYLRIRGEHMDNQPSVKYSVNYVSRGGFGIAGFVAWGILQKFVAVFRRIDERLPESFSDPLGAKGFEDVSKSTLQKAKNLAQRWRYLVKDAVVPESLAEFVLTAPDSLVARMRPYALAKQLGTSRSETLEFCCLATRDGFLDMSWSLICPSCGGAKSSSANLDDLGTEAHCDVCNIRYDADLERNVELSFKPRSTFRALDEQEYCLQSPSHQLQIIAQVNVMPGDTVRLPLSLRPGHYRLRCIGLEGETLFDCAYGRQSKQITLCVGSRLDQAEIVCGSTFELHLQNESPYWRTIRFEHHGYREDAACAAEVTGLREFRETLNTDISLPPALADSKM
jgi:adenylate cyclase